MALLFAMVVEAGAFPLFAQQRCDRVVSYLAPSGTPASDTCDWRIYDPITGRDTRFLSLRESPRSVRWDTSFAKVEYSVGDVIYRGDWRFGAEPKVVAQLPKVSSICDWWFNPDSLCYQLLSSEQLAVSGASADSALPVYRHELWQSTRDGSKWYLLAADTEKVVYDECESDLWRAARSKHAPAVTEDQLWDRMFGASAMIRDAVEIAPPDSSLQDLGRWLFAPFKAAPHRGLEMCLMIDIEIRVNGPIFLVDRKQGSRQLLCGSEDYGTLYSFAVQEECGHLLVNCSFDEARVLDVATGKSALGAPNEMSSALWVPRPHR